MGTLWQSLVGLLSQILLWLTDATGNLGSAIILFTIFTRVAMLPLTLKQLKSSKKMQELQPVIAQLKRKYGKDQQRFAQEMTKVYREYKVNPAGSCLPILIQMPIFLGVYQAIIRLVTSNNGVSSSFLWVPDLSKADPYYILPILSVVLQLLVSLMAMPKIQDPTTKATSQAFLIMPVVFGFFALTFNAGAVLNWVTGALLSAIQQFFVTGWGSLSNYLTFLPERKGFMTPNPVAVPVDDTEDEPEAVVANFWAPLKKLQTSPVIAGDEATEQAIAAAKQQNRPRKRN